MSRAQELLTDAITVEGEAVDPTLILGILGVVKDLILGCRGNGASQAQIVSEIRGDEMRALPAFARKLRRAIGKDKYNAVGGKRYAREVFRRAQGASYANVREFVKESVS